LFWGSLWGLEEATLGHILHLLPVNIGWIFWFPFAYLFLYLAYKKSGNAFSILWTAAIASAIKLIDLLLPVRIDMVINPAVSILLEGAAVFLFVKVIHSHPSLEKLRFIRPLASSLVYQLFYIIYISIAPLFFTVIPAVSNTDSYLIYGLHGLVNGFILLIASGCYILLLGRKDTAQQQIGLSKQLPVLLSVMSYLMPLIALFVQWAM
jgi:hypothetical protein